MELRGTKGGALVAKHIRAFADDQRGQDFVEYTLLIAFVAIVSSAIFMLASEPTTGIWCHANSQISYGASLASR
jgi:Flp pilus assembly pilin Flp